MTDRNGCVDDLAVIHRFEAVSYCFFFFYQNPYRQIGILG